MIILNVHPPPDAQDKNRSKFFPNWGSTGVRVASPVHRIRESSG
jgi:hypothetical protein